MTLPLPPDDVGGIVNDAPPVTAVALAVVLIAAVLLGALPWAVRFVLWLDLGDMYERYAKWACQC